MRMWQLLRIHHVLTVEEILKRCLSVSFPRGATHLKALHQVHLVVRVPRHVAPEVFQLLDPAVIHEQPRQLHRPFPVLPSGRIEAYVP